MAKQIKLRGRLSFRDSEPEPRTEKAKTERLEPVESSKALIEKIILSPFQRAKLGAGDIFLAAEAIPAIRAVN